MFSKRSICALVLLAGSAASCSCEDQIIAARPNFVASTSRLSYDLVCLESTNVLEVTLQNRGNSPGNLTWVVAPVNRDTDAAMFTTSPEGVLATSVSAGGSQVITVTYHPSDALAGDVSQLGLAHQAVLRLTTDDPDNPTIEILLDGTVSEQVPTPILSIRCPDDAVTCGTTDGPCCSDLQVSEATPGSNGRFRILQSSFGTAVSGSTREMKVVFSNLGCGQLDLSKDWTFDSLGECAASSLTIPDLEAGMSIPGSPTEDRIESRDVTLRFQAPPDNCGLFGDVVLATNDPAIQAGGAAASWGKIKVDGEASAPDISIIPVGGLSYGEVNDGMCLAKTLVIHNTSSVAIKLDPLEIVPGVSGKGTDYKVKKVEVDPGCNGGWVAWNFDDELAPNDGEGGCGPDEVRVEIEYCPGTGNDLTTDNDELLVKFTGGQLRSALKGGSNPELEVVGAGFGDKMWYGPRHFGCLGCGICPAAECTDDGDCTGEPCLKVDGAPKGVCASEPACLDRCGFKDRQVLLCNVGKGDLVVTGLTVTDQMGSATDLFNVFPKDCLNKVIKERTTNADCCGIVVSANSAAAGRIDDGLANLVITSNDATFPGTVPLSFLFEQSTGDDYSQPLPDIKVKAQTTCALVTGSTMVGDPIFLDARDSENSVNYRWRIDSVPTDADPKLSSMIPVGDVNPASPGTGLAFGTYCDGSMPSPPSSVLQMTPDVGGRPIPADYRVTLTVDDGTCATDPTIYDPIQTTKIIQVTRPSP